MQVAFNNNIRAGVCITLLDDKSLELNSMYAANVTRILAT